MEVRQLGRVGPTVSAIGLGCMPMSGVYGNTTDAEGIAAIHRALDLGISLLDTADVYGNGHNEQLVGRAIRGRRDEVVLATKFGNVRDAAGRPAGISGRPEYVREACEASLARLGVDTIDLPGQVALAWLLSRRPWIVPIPGTKRTAYVEDNALAPQLTLTASDQERLDALSAEVQGSRYGGDGRTPDWVSPPLPL